MRSAVRMVDDVQLPTVAPRVTDVFSFIPVVVSRVRSRSGWNTARSSSGRPARKSLVKCSEGNGLRSIRSKDPLYAQKT